MIEDYILALEIVNASKEQLKEWAEYVEIAIDEESGDEFYYWANNTPSELRNLDPYDVILEFWRK